MITISPGVIHGTPAAIDIDKPLNTNVLTQTPEEALECDESRLLHQLESVMRQMYVREMPASSRHRVAQLLLYRYTEA